jgi:hypothetical protein
MDRKTITLKRRAYLKLLRRAEISLIRRSSAILSVSASEAKEIEALTAVPSVYVPIVAETLGLRASNPKDGRPRIWFYGGSGATANRWMMRHLRETLFEIVSRRCPSVEFHHIGSTGTSTTDVRNWLEEHFVSHGFVPDPSSLFAAGDICLIPYQHDTGFRTKIPELLSCGVIPAGYAVSFVCCPELVSGTNCVASDSPIHLADEIARVLEDAVLRKSLSRGASETFRREFMVGRLDGRYRALLDA